MRALLCSTDRGVRLTVRPQFPCRCPKHKCFGTALTFNSSGRVPDHQETLRCTKCGESSKYCEYCNLCIVASAGHVEPHLPRHRGRRKLDSSSTSTPAASPSTSAVVVLAARSPVATSSPKRARRVSDAALGLACSRFTKADGFDTAPPCGVHLTAEHQHSLERLLGRTPDDIPAHDGGGGGSGSGSGGGGGGGDWRAAAIVRRTRIIEEGKKLLAFVSSLK